MDPRRLPLLLARAARLTENTPRNQLAALVARLRGRPRAAAARRRVGRPARHGSTRRAAGFRRNEILSVGRSFPPTATRVQCRPHWRFIDVKRARHHGVWHDGKIQNVREHFSRRRGQQPFTALVRFTGDGPFRSTAKVLAAADEGLHARQHVGDSLSAGHGSRVVLSPRAEQIEGPNQGAEGLLGLSFTFP